VDEKRNFFQYAYAAYCVTESHRLTSSRTKPKTILKVAGTMSVKPPVVHLDEIWTGFGPTRQGHAFGFCVWMLAAMNRHVSTLLITYLRGGFLKDIRAGYKFGYDIHYTGIFSPDTWYFICSYN
jgi:hypothetical protein